MAETFNRIQSEAYDFQSQPLFITANFILMTVVASNAYLLDQDIQQWQKIYAPIPGTGYALVSAHLLNGQKYCIVGGENNGLALAAYESLSWDAAAVWTDAEGGLIQGYESVINIPGDTYYSGQQLILFNGVFDAPPNEVWSFVS